VPLWKDNAIAIFYYFEHDFINNLNLWKFYFWRD